MAKATKSRQPAKGAPPSGGSAKPRKAAKAAPRAARPSHGPNKIAKKVAVAAASSKKPVPSAARPVARMVAKSPSHPVERPAAEPIKVTTVAARPTPAPEAKVPIGIEQPPQAAAGESAPPALPVPIASFTF
jgi:hypothetical protein